MKKVSVFLCGMLLVFSVSTEVKAELISYGDYVYDFITDKFWVRDTLRYADMTKDEQIREFHVERTTDGITRRYALAEEVAALFDNYTGPILTWCFIGEIYGGYWKDINGDWGDWVSGGFYQEYKIQGRTAIPIPRPPAELFLPNYIITFRLINSQLRTVNEYPRSSIFWSFEIQQSSYPYAALYQQYNLHDSTRDPALGAWVIAEGNIISIPTVSEFGVSFGSIRFRSNYNFPYDIDRDGDVDGSDLAEFANGVV